MDGRRSGWRRPSTCNCIFYCLLLLFNRFSFEQNSSRNSSPDNDFVDVEGTEQRPMSAASNSSQKAGTSSSMLMPEGKRGRGRPRKNRGNLEDGENCFYCVSYYIFGIVENYLFIFFIITACKQTKKTIMHCPNYST